METSSALKENLKQLEIRINKIERQIKADLIPSNNILKKKFKLEIAPLNQILELSNEWMKEVFHALNLNTTIQPKRIPLPQIESLYSIPAIKLVNLPPTQLNLSLSLPLDFSKLNLDHLLEKQSAFMEELLQEIERKTREKLDEHNQEY